MPILFRSKKSNLIFGASILTGVLMLVGFLMKNQLGFGAIFTITMLLLNGAAMAYNVNCLDFGGCNLWSTILTIFIIIGLIGSFGGAVYMVLGKKNDVAEAPTATQSAAAEAEGFWRGSGYKCRCRGKPCKCGGRGW